MYLTSIGKLWEKAYDQIFNFAKEKNIPIAFSPGTHQIESINDKVREIIASSKMFFSNKEEAEAILGKNADSDIKELLTLMKNNGPEIVSITDGAKGAYAIDKQGIMYFIKPSPAEGHDKTGAGDAYATGFFASILHGNDIPTSMLWGALNSGGVIQKMGSQNGLLTKKELDGEAKSTDNLIAEKI